MAKITVRIHVELNFSFSFPFEGNTVKNAFITLVINASAFSKRRGARNQKGALEKGTFEKGNIT